MLVELVMSTPSHLIGESAKTCYNSKLIVDGGKNITSNIVHGHGHLAVLRFAFMIFHVEDISVACQNQLVRSKHLDFLVESKRYVDLNKGNFKFIMPVGLGILQEKAMYSHWENSKKLYAELIEQGVKKEDARAILPANTSTSLNIAGNLQAYWDMFKLRLNKHAQTEIRTLAKEMWDIASVQFPEVFTDDVYQRFSNE